MKLRSIRVRHWGCIGSLELTDLPDGVVVLHGPNRTGKSSLCQALRSCLFDHDHTSQDKTIKAAIPWRTQAAPEVTIEFDLGPRRYRIAKTFAKTRGHAIFEERSAEGWRTVERGKTACDQVRRLLGADGSEQGLQQLLWLRQGEIQLPDKLDGQLATDLNKVLGTMITGSDAAFKTALDNDCDKWFSPGKMEYRKNSTVKVLENQLTDARGRVDEVNRRMGEVEAQLRDYENARLALPGIRQAEKEAEDELRRLGEERERIKERVHQHELAREQEARVRETLAKAEARLRERDALQVELEGLNAQLVEARGRLESVGGQLKEAETAAAAATDALAKARARLEQHQSQRGEIDARQKLLDSASRMEKLENQVNEVKELQARIDERRAELNELVVPSEVDLKRLHEDKAKITELAARLEAGELRLTFTPERDVEVTVALDGGDPERANLAAGNPRQWLARQRLVLAIPQVGQLEMGRNAADQTLEEVANDLATRQRVFVAQLNSFQVSPEAPDALDELRKRLMQREQLESMAKTDEKTLAKLAPRGLASLEAQAAAEKAARAQLLATHPTLAQWTPSQADVDHFRTAHDECTTALTTECRRAEEAGSQAQLRLNETKSKSQELEKTVVRVEAEIGQVQSRLASFEAHEELIAARDHARERLAEAEETVRATTLTPEESKLDEAHASAHAAAEHRRRRREEAEARINQLQGMLANIEGLHAIRIEAEQAMTDLKRAYDRERLRAEAHRRLKELFDDAYRCQVSNVVQPVSAKVLEWMGQLGLKDYVDLGYDPSSPLPARLRRAGAGSEEDVAIERESHGTIEQLGLLIRLAIGSLFAKNDGVVAILDDPIVHADAGKHRRMIEILQRLTTPRDADAGGEGSPWQILILTCHPERFDYLVKGTQFDLAKLIQPEA